MPVIPPVSVQPLSVLACQRTLVLLKSLSDGQWASIAQLSAATDLKEDNVVTGLADLEEHGLVQRIAGRYRIDCAAVHRALDLIRHDLCGRQLHEQMDCQ